MKVIYISDHGFGHLIRNIPLLDRFSEKEKVYVACSPRQIDFLKRYFVRKQHQFIFREVKTDVGFINYQNSLRINKKKTQTAILQFMNDLPELVRQEAIALKNEKFREIYIDISPLGLLTAKTLKKKALVLTNFTWYKQYEHLKFNRKIIDFYYELDQMIDELWMYPLAFPFKYIHCIKRDIAFLPRPIDEKKVSNLKSTYKKIVSILSGMSSQMVVQIKNYNGLIITTNKIKVKYDGPMIVLGDECLDSQNYIAASDVVITKAGFTTVSECIYAKVKMVLVERPSAYEDTYLIEKIKKQKLGQSIPQQDLKNLDLSVFL